MNLRGLVSVSGKPGLYKLLGQNKSGFILESLDAQKAKIVINMTTSKMASLEDITVFGEQDDLKLVDIFELMKDHKDIPDVKSADAKKLRSFFREVAPSHDENRVYTSDVKKIISWFNIIKELPLFNEDTPEPPAQGVAASDNQIIKKPDLLQAEKAKVKSTKAAGKTTTRLSQKSK